MKLEIAIDPDIIIWAKIYHSPVFSTSKKRPKEFNPRLNRFKIRYIANCHLPLRSWSPLKVQNFCIVKPTQKATKNEATAEYKYHQPITSVKKYRAIRLTAVAKPPEKIYLIIIYIKIYAKKDFFKVLKMIILCQNSNAKARAALIKIPPRVF